MNIIDFQLGPYTNPVPMALNEISKLKELGDHSTAEKTIDNLAAFMTFAECKKFYLYFLPPSCAKHPSENEPPVPEHCKGCFEKHKDICTFLFDEYPEIFVKELEKHSNVDI